MKFRVGGRVHEVVRRADGVYSVDGTEIPASVKSAGDGRLQGSAGARRFSVDVARSGDRIYAQVGDRALVLSALARGPAAAGDASLAGALEAPMPGRVTRVSVTIGDVVERGQELLVVEAMKMENALVAPSRGRVEAINTAIGAMVSPGEPLVVINSSGE